MALKKKTFCFKLTTTDSFAYASLAIIIFTIYANSFTAAWQYDDYLNIVKNTNIQLEEFSLNALSRTFHGARQHSSAISRPLAFLSFAINYYFHRYNVVGYHLANVLIHLVTSLFLYHFIKSVLALPLFKRRYSRQVEAISLLTVFFWASHPINVTAVTYIVQRMASMAGMFYVMGMYFFVKGRLSASLHHKYFFWCLTALSGLLALASKENAVIFPLALLFLDMMVLNPPTTLKKKRYLFLIGGVLGAIFLVSIYYLDWSKIHQSYTHRPFTLWQRLLTEPRVIILYISLLFYPTRSRLTLIHDVTISSDIFSPLTTLPAIIFLVVVIAGIFLWRRRFKLEAFCVLFFFLNHLVEGSVISLELIYEHRNYIPSMLIFLPLAIFVVNMLSYFSLRLFMQGLVAFCASFVLAAHAHTTFCYNDLFKNELTLWQDNVQKSPNLSITHNNYGQALRMRGRDDEAAVEFNKALKLDRYLHLRQKGIVLYNVGLALAYEKKLYSKALTRFIEALTYLPAHPDLIKHTAYVALLLNQKEYAKRLLLGGIKAWPDNQELICALGILHLAENKPLTAFKLSSRIYPTSSHALTAHSIMAKACQDRNDKKLAVSYWKKVIRKDPANCLAAFALVVLYNELEQIEQRDRYLGLLVYFKEDKTWKEYYFSIYNTLMNRFFLPPLAQIESIISP